MQGQKALAESHTKLLVVFESCFLCWWQMTIKYQVLSPVYLVRSLFPPPACWCLWLKCWGLVGLPQAPHLGRAPFQAGTWYWGSCCTCPVDT